MSLYQVGAILGWRHTGLALYRVGAIPGWRYAGLALYRVGAMPGWRYAGLALRRVGALGLALLGWRDRLAPLVGTSWRYRLGAAHWGSSLGLRPLHYRLGAPALAFLPLRSAFILPPSHLGPPTLGLAPWRSHRGAPTLALPPCNGWHHGAHALALPPLHFHLGTHPLLVLPPYRFALAVGIGALPWRSRLGAPPWRSALALPPWRSAFFVPPPVLHHSTHHKSRVQPNCESGEKQHHAQNLGWAPP